MLHKYAHGGIPAKEVVIHYVIIIIVILLVPAINLSGLTQSRMRKRLSEIGVRKAFGANRSVLLKQVTCRESVAYADRWCGRTSVLLFCSLAVIGLAVGICIIGWRYGRHERVHDKSVDIFCSLSFLLGS